MDKKSLDDVLNCIDNLTVEDLDKLESESREMEQDYKLNQNIHEKWVAFKKNSKDNKA